MLVRRGVINRVDLPGFDGVLQAGGVADRAEEGHQLNLDTVTGRPTFQLGMNGIKTELVVFEQHQRFRARKHDLTAQLATN